MTDGVKDGLRDAPLVRTASSEAANSMGSATVKKRVVLVNPPIVSDVGDYASSGIPHMPVILASLNGFLESKGIDTEVIDLFGESPKTITRRGHMLVHGSPISSLVGRIRDGDIVFVYASFAFAHTVNVDIVRQIMSSCSARIFVIENAQSALGYDISLFRGDFMMAGAADLILGDPESQAMRAIEGGGINGRRMALDLKSLPMPSWRGFPLENYWSYPFAHAPRSKSRYMSIMTSRGCPNSCRFCCAGGINGGSRRSRTDGAVFEEIVYWYGNGVSEFHICDLNPTVDRKMWSEIGVRLMLSCIDVKLRFATGVKLETIDSEFMERLLRMGVDYISFSPESGSETVLKSVNKTFDHEHAIQMLKLINGRAITQACFVMGLPGETPYDKKLTVDYINALAEAGLDEIALFNFAPMPGSDLYLSYKVPMEKMTFSAGWPDDHSLSVFKAKTVAGFYLRKMVARPFMTIGRFFRTKTWMTIKRIIITKFYEKTGRSSRCGTTTENY